MSLSLHVIQKLGDNAKDQIHSVIYPPNPMVSNDLKVDAIKLRDRGIGRKLSLRLLYKKQIVDERILLLKKPEDWPAKTL